MNQKMQWLRNKMLSLDLQGIIISNPINIKYLTGLDAEGTLLVTRKENIYITDGRYIEYVHSTLTLFDEIIVYDAKDISSYDFIYPSLSKISAIDFFILDAGISTVLNFALFAFLILVSMSAIGSVVFI